MNSERPSTPRPSIGDSAQRLLRGVDGHVAMLLLIGIAVFLAMSLARPRTFPTLLNISSMATQLSEIGVLTLGMVLAMLIGGIDLSINATANLSAIFAAMVLKFYLPDGDAAGGAALYILLAFGTGLLTGALCGAFNGYLIGYVRVPAILATLSTMTLLTGLAVGITGGSTISGFPPAVLRIGNGTILGLPIPLIVLLLLAFAVWFLLARTTYGFRVYMLGTNPIAAQFSGINNRRVIMTTHILTGLLAASTGLLALARTNSANADYGSSYILMTLLIAVLGGIAVTGGFGRIAGVLLALVVLQFLSTGFNMLLVRFGGSNFFRDFAWGLLLLLVTSLTAWRLRRSGQRGRIKQRVAQGPAK